MASTAMDISKMKVVDLRKELKTRGLSHAGDKAELIARLQAAMSQDEHGDITLDSDEIDSDGVLEDEDDKSQADILDDPAVDTLNEELALSEQTPAKSTTEIKPQRTLKRKITASTSDDRSKENSENNKSTENKDTTVKKIVLNRATSITAVPSDKADVEGKSSKGETTTSSSNKVKITADLDVKTRLELRAKRFGLPVKMSEDERKQARKQRFGQSNSTSAAKSVSSTTSGTLTENMEKLRKRAERFGQSVSKIMTDIENKEKLEKRKAKFSTVA